MTKTQMNRIKLGSAVFALVIGGAAVAAAETAGPSGHGARMHCDGKHEGAGTKAERAQHQAERFQKADTNSDGFLTKDEVGDKRWEHIKVADANNDAKVSKAELEQAHKDGKLGHRGEGNGARS